MATSRQKQVSSLHWRKQREQCLWQNKVKEGVPEHFPTNLSARAPLILFCVLVLGWIMILILHVYFYPSSLLKYFIHASPAIQPWWTLALGFDISSPSISTQGPITTKTCISNTLLVPRSEHTFLPNPTSPPWVDSQTSDSFSSFSDLGAAHHSCFSFIPKSTLPSWRPTNHMVIQSHSWSFKQSCPKTSPFLPALLPNLHNWSSSTQDQDLDCYFTVHWLISIFSSDFFFYLFTFLALCLCPSSAFICQTSSFLQSTA